MKRQGKVGGKSAPPSVHGSVHTTKRNLNTSTRALKKKKNPSSPNAGSKRGFAIKRPFKQPSPDQDPHYNNDVRVDFGGIDHDREALRGLGFSAPESTYERNMNQYLNAAGVEHKVASPHRIEKHDYYTMDSTAPIASQMTGGYPEMDLPENKGRPLHPPKPLLKPHPYGDLKPFYIDRPTRGRHDPLPTSAVGERLHTSHYEKFRHDPHYNITKQASGYNRWYETNAVLTPQNGILRDYYTKTYIRDPKTLEATMPEMYRKRVNLDELQKILQKADHYFFEDRPAPVAQLLVPLRDPRTILPNSPLSSLVTSMEKKYKVGLPFSLDEEGRKKVEKHQKEIELPRMKNDRELMTYMQGQMDKMYTDQADGQKEYLDYLNDLDQRAPNMNLVIGQHWTAQMRRAEFWRKYLELFTVVDLLHTTTVRCTRAVGRVDSAAALVIMGNNRGIFTYGRGKASVHEQAVRIALLKTRRNVLFTPIHENRAPYYSITGKFKASTIVLKPQPRGVGLRAGRLTFSLLESIGYKDASAKLRGRPNIWNIVRAWMECLKFQESYREIANMRGAHYQQMMNPWTKAPPVPSREEVQELEDVAAQAFKEAVIDIFKSRQLYETETFKPLVPHFTQRANWIEKWDRYLDMANVPQSIRLYPGFSEYLDAAKLVQEKRFREEVHSDLDDAWSPTETDAEVEAAGYGKNEVGPDSNSLFDGGRENPLRYRTSRDDQPYYQFYKPVEKPQFNSKAMRFTAFNGHIQDLAKDAYQKAVGIDESVNPFAIRGEGFNFPTQDARTELLNAHNAKY